MEALFWGYFPKTEFFALWGIFSEKFWLHSGLAMDYNRDIGRGDVFGFIGETAPAGFGTCEIISLYGR